MDLGAILEKEGIEKGDQGLDECETVLSEEGFFSFRYVHGLPYLVHFWIDPKKRTPRTFYKMAKRYKDLIRSKGFKYTIINAPESGYVTQFVEAYTRHKPYSRQHGQHYYLLGVDPCRRTKPPASLG